jgi:hypothetical protein
MFHSWIAGGICEELDWILADYDSLTFDQFLLKKPKILSKITRKICMFFRVKIFNTVFFWGIFEWTISTLSINPD